MAPSRMRQNRQFSMAGVAVCLASLMSQNMVRIAAVLRLSSGAVTPQESGIGRASLRANSPKGDKMNDHFARCFGTAAMCLALVACGNVTHPTVNFHQRLDGSGALVPAVTDQTPLDLPTTFGSGFLFGVLADLNQSGDYLFTGRGQSGVFLRPAGAAAPMRLLQGGDEVPGFPGSRVDIIRSNLRLNDA